MLGAFADTEGNGGGELGWLAAERVNGAKRGTEPRLDVPTLLPGLALLGLALLGLALLDLALLDLALPTSP